MTLNEKLLDKLILHFLGQERLKNGAVKRYVPILRKVDSLLLGLFSGAYFGNKQDMHEFIQRVKREKRTVYDKFEIELTKELERLARKESQFMVNFFSGLLTAGLINGPERKKIERIIKSEVRGFTIHQMIRRLEQSDINKYISTAKTVVNDGLTLQQATRELRGQVNANNRDASTIVHTVMADIITKSDNLVIQSNRHLIKGVMLAVTFDNRTSSICIQHSQENILYPIDNYPNPPFHPNCRTRAVPVTYSFSELAGKTQRKIPVGTRQSMTGDVPISFTYNDWIKRQSVSIQNDVLGVTKARLYRKNKYNINRFIDPTGKFYTIDELYR